MEHNTRPAPPLMKNDLGLIIGQSINDLDIII